jgi:hypothetical protein
VAIGDSAGLIAQGSTLGFTTALGAGAGYSNQGPYATALGAYSGMSSQGAYSIAIGTYAGSNNQSPNSIAISGSNTAINPTTPGLFVNPLRSDTSTAGLSNLQWNATTKEITCGTTGGGGSAVTSIVAGSNIAITPISGLGNVTINALSVPTWYYASQNQAVTANTGVTLNPFPWGAVNTNSSAAGTQSWTSPYNCYVKVLFTFTVNAAVGIGGDNTINALAILQGNGTIPPCNLTAVDAVNLTANATNANMSAQYFGQAPSGTVIQVSFANGGAATLAMGGSMIVEIVGRY